MDSGAESPNEEEDSRHSPDDDLAAPSTVNTPAPTDNTADTHDHPDVPHDTHDHPDVPADTTTAHHPVAALPTSEDELTVPELQEWLTKHAKQRDILFQTVKGVRSNRKDII